ncbi:response regulator transcription factor [Lactobacillus sp. PV037]|uniref:LytR/AlgR family response regulator transcription factor n=1 Tax=unclassified Lactobacillus TaxID=2620435 RepID=UPI002240189D|nr:MULTISPECIES: LytTR family DNA-binding domain-containing protein [unclassified Lactobacillus]QNQ82696.1 response regulator transcription factor [Lactobacillus sp. PV012]QNQ83185.1 response regulator transcription factor [Lactobacillus sp. PV037]
MKYSVFICDDEQEQITNLKNIMEVAEMYLSDEKEVKFNLITYESYQGAMEGITEGRISSGIYFLDVELENKTDSNTGFDLAELIKKRDERAQIIFVTSHEDLSLITFERYLGPVDYIIKTSDTQKLKKRIMKALKKAMANLDQFNKIKRYTFSYKVGRRINNIRIDDVICIVTSDLPHRLLLKKTMGKADFIGTINQYEKENPMLVKISQSCLVNPQNIKTIDLKNKLVEFVNGDIEPYSRTKKKEMKELLNKFNYKESWLEVN